MGKAINIWINVALLIIALALLSCNSMYRTPILVVGGIGAAGKTYCDLEGRPAILIAPQVFANEVNRILTLTHEMVQVEQSRRMKGCWKMMALYLENPDIRMKLEIEAFCASNQVLVERYGLSRAEVTDSLVSVIKKAYQVPHDTAEIRRRIPCKEN